MCSWAEARTFGTESGGQDQEASKGRRKRYFTTVHECKHMHFDLVSSLYCLSSLCDSSLSASTLRVARYRVRACSAVPHLRPCVTSLPVKTTCDRRRPFSFPPSHLHVPSLAHTSSLEHHIPLLTSTSSFIHPTSTSTHTHQQQQHIPDFSSTTTHFHTQSKPHPATDQVHPSPSRSIATS